MAMRYAPGPGYRLARAPHENPDVEMSFGRRSPDTRPDTVRIARTGRERMQLHRPEKYPHALMIPTVIRYASRLALIVVMATIALIVLFLAIVVIARYEPDDGYCPGAPLGELEARILSFAEARGMRPDDIEFVGMPRYHADRLGWWHFDLKSGEASYVATIDCGRHVTGFGKFQMLPLEPATVQRSHSSAGIEPRAVDPVPGYR
ncbi:hypothetical protein [Burkholderia sp. BCC0397]|uniref:hypothetical protein n=1 Tax=Burkholderia sp. BCC0397 TaxID=486876 RepID=UPI001589DB28|nr:hypothetical protein [Burkholderia sp. BCC0397]